MLAQDCHIPSVVPAALYCLTTLPSECIFDELVMLSTSTSGLRFRLSTAQQRMVFVGRDRLSEAVRIGPLRFLATHAEIPPCRTSACRDAFNVEIQTLWKHASDPYCNYAFGDFPVEELGFETPCAVCLMRARQVHRQSQAELWDRLPELFGLDSWDFLRSETL
jgi:hypothetical protein